MAPPLCETPIPELQAPWTGLNAAIRFYWTSDHPWIEVRAITISGAEVFDEHVMVENGEEIRIDEAFVPFGCAVSWSVVVFVGDVTDTPIDGLSIFAEFTDALGRGVRRAICGCERAAANRAVQFEGIVDAPERDYA